MRKEIWFIRETLKTGFTKETARCILRTARKNMWECLPAGSRKAREPCMTKRGMWLPRELLRTENRPCSKLR